MQYLVYTNNGKYIVFKIYQSILQFKEGKDGQIQLKLISTVAYIYSLPN